MKGPLLEIEHLSTWIGSSGGIVRAVDDLSLDIGRGETFALLGESGCGKSMTALSIMRLLPESAGIIHGRIRFDGTELLELPETKMRSIRGKRIGMIFQEPMLSLNPVMTVGAQVAEVLRLHTGRQGETAVKKVKEMLDAVGIPEASRRSKEYPFQLSGGMKQRVMIAMALACDPDLLIADEPTTALDVTTQAQVLDLLRLFQKRTDMAILLITHDLGVVSEMAGRVAVMYAGEIVEKADRDRFFAGPVHPYSQKLFAALPERNKRGKTLAVIRGSVPPLTRSFTGCRFAERCDFLQDRCRQKAPDWKEWAGGQGVRCHLFKTGPREVPVQRQDKGVSSEQERSEIPFSGQENGSFILKVEDLKVYFPIRKGLLKRIKGYVKAVDGVSFAIPFGRTLALVGESGCGKTTLGKGIMRLIPVTGGSVWFQGRDLGGLAPADLRPLRREFQMIFQDPYGSLNPRMQIKEIIEEGMTTLDIGFGPSDRTARLEKLLEEVGLSGGIKHRYPHEFSGGQRQRIAIARALSVDPKLIICDEPTSALDISVQAQILNLLKELQERLGLSYLFITHNISVVAFLAHEVAVMYLGRIVEQGTVDEVLAGPRHPYTRALLSAVPVIDRGTNREVIKLPGDLPSPVNPPDGCYFHPRCPEVMSRCRERYPAQTSFGRTHSVHCHLFE
ncbi:MAG: ABC transporter ATP-binding protein [Thermodesulfobacteriota bacterium]